MRVIGLDIHRSFAEAAEVVDGSVRHLGRSDAGRSPARRRELPDPRTISRLP